MQNYNLGVGLMVINAGFISSLLYCLCLKMTADFGNFVAKTDEKRKTKDEMNPAIMTF